MSRKRRTWNLNHFNEVNLPTIVGRVTPSVFSEFSGIRVLDMPVYMPGQGWRVPQEIKQFREVAKQVVQFESQYGNFEKDHYVYITVDQKTVQAGTTGRRAGSHSDAYIELDNEQFDVIPANYEYIAREVGEVSHTYIVSDCFPTEFFNAPFPLTDPSCEGSLKTFDEVSDRNTPLTFMPYTVLMLDPFVIHRCVVANKTRKRTFVKISISKKQYARQGNTINPMFAYNWKLQARSPHKRNHPWNNV